MASVSDRIRPRDILRILMPYGLILVAAVAFTWASRMNHYRRYLDLKGREASLSAEIDSLGEEIQLLQRRLHAIDHDPFLIEKQVRERFGFVRPDEITLGTEGHVRRSP